MNDLPVYLTPKKFADIIGVSTSTVRRWEKEGAFQSGILPLLEKKRNLDFMCVLKLCPGAEIHSLTDLK